jgi:hypothetical protein
MITKEEILESPVTREDINELSSFHNFSCISIFLPTHRAGVETLRGEDSLNLKNNAKMIKQKLLNRGMNATSVENFMRPVSDLVEDHDFWRHQSDGLAVFLSEGFFKRYTVPLRFEPVNYLSSEFYLIPLMPLFNGDGLFHLLTLKKDEVLFYQGSKFGITAIDMKSSIPSRLEDRVGYDYEQKQLQFRTQLGPRGAGSFHGHGESEARDKNELLLFFRAIDKGLMSQLHDFQEPPLLLCCIDYYFPIYKEANTHKNLFPRHISCNPASLSSIALHKKAWDLMQPFFEQIIHEKKDRFLSAFDKGRASSDIKEIIPAAVQGKVDTLFMQKDMEVFGIYDPSTGELIINEEDHSEPNVSLLNLAAKKVFGQGGSVYLLDMQDMPDGNSGINALFRY